MDNPRGQEEVLDPRFNRRPPLTMCYPPVTNDPKETPNVQDFQTMSVENVQGVYPLSLGRNVLTRVHDTKLSRRLATLEFRKPKVDAVSSSSSRGHVQRTLSGGNVVGRGNVSIATVGPQLVLKVNQSNKLHKVCMNGSRVLVDEVDVKHNDVIALHGEKYRYRVIIIQEENEQGEVVNPSGNATMATSHQVRILRGMSNASQIVSGRTSNPNSELSFQTQTSLGLSPEISSSSASCNRENVNHPSQETMQESLPSQQQVETLEDNFKREDEDDMDESPLDKIQSVARQHILDDVSCTICMEILVNTHVANPCGHVFCKSCIDRIPSVRHKRYMTKSCPSCRKEITSLSWARSYDSIIWNMVLMGEIFGGDVHGEEDLNQFLIRSGKNLNDLSEEQKACIFQQCRHQGNKKRKFDSFVYSNSNLGKDNNVDHFVINGGEDSDGSIVIEETPPRRQVGTTHSRHGVAFVGGVPRFFGPTGGNRFFMGRSFLRGYDASREMNGHAGTVEDPICLDD